MKKILLLLSLYLSLTASGQKISELPGTSTATGGYIPVSIGTTTYKLITDSLRGVRSFNKVDGWGIVASLTSANTYPLYNAKVDSATLSSYYLRRNEINNYSTISDLADTADAIRNVINYNFTALTESGGNVSVNYSNKVNFYFTITGNDNISFTNVRNGQTIYIRVTQDATGGHTLTFPSNTYFPLGFATGTTLNLSTAAGAIDKIAITYNSIIDKYEIEMAKNYGNP